MSCETMAKEIVNRIINGNQPLEDEVKWVAAKIRAYAKNAWAIGKSDGLSQKTSGQDTDG